MRKTPDPRLRRKRLRNRQIATKGERATKAAHRIALQAPDMPPLRIPSLMTGALYLNTRLLGVSPLHPVADSADLKS